MRARTAIARTAHRVRLTAVGWGLLTTMLACVALSACTSTRSTLLPFRRLSPTASGSVSSERARPAAAPAASESGSAQPVGVGQREPRPPVGLAQPVAQSLARAPRPARCPPARRSPAAAARPDSRTPGSPCSAERLSWRASQASPTAAG